MAMFCLAEQSTPHDCGACILQFWCRSSRSGNKKLLLGWGQDVQDIINDDLERFGKTGQAGALGITDCMGDVQKQQVKLGLHEQLKNEEMKKQTYRPVDPARPRSPPGSSVAGLFCPFYGSLQFTVPQCTYNLLQAYM